jgi:hypothetical protein
MRCSLCMQTLRPGGVPAAIACSAATCCLLASRVFVTPYT